MSSPFTAVLTTIQQPTTCVLKLADKLAGYGAEVIVVGDRKGPSRYNVPNSRLLTLEDQLQSSFQLAKVLPTNHYSRKNLGYLTAIQLRAQYIYETDDDNAPNDSWKPRERIAQARPIDGRPWVNVYRLFSSENIWPRGFPLDRVTDPSTYRIDETIPEQSFDAPIQQGLANGSPDVDAIWRLVLDRPFEFAENRSVWFPS